MAEAHWSHDIKDPEAFVGTIIQRSRLELDYHRRERLHQFLLIALWELSLQYRPGIIRKGFSTWAGIALNKRIIDWERSPEEGGRTRWQFRDRVYERNLPVVTSLDDRPDDPVYVEFVDVGSYSDSVARRVLRERGSNGSGGEYAVGEAKVGRAA